MACHWHSTDMPFWRDKASILTIVSQCYLSPNEYYKYETFHENLKKWFTRMSKWLHSGLLARIKEPTLMKIILTVNFVIAPVCTATYVQEQLSERELNSLMFYKFCMSEMSTWKLCRPPPFLRQLAMMLLQSCIIAKFGIYLKMWMKASRTA